MQHPVALTIAGSDPSGGAGAQADLKTFHQHGVYGAAAISLITVQNTRGCDDVVVLDAGLVRAQIEAVLLDLPVAVLKTGALGSAENVSAVANVLRGRDLPLVVDPVRVATVGTTTGLLRDEAREVVLQELAPLATLLTPNMREAAWLTGRDVESLPQMRDAAHALIDLGARAVLVKGGHLAFTSDHPAIDVLVLDGSLHELHAERVVTPAGHGTGCSLASAIAARLALGETLEDAVILGKEWVRRALVSAPPLGGGAWPIDHFAPVPPSKRAR